MNTTAEQVVKLRALHEAATEAVSDNSDFANDLDRDLSIVLRNNLPSILSDLERLAELEAIVDRLPKTADGVPVTPGMEVWTDYWSGPQHGIVRRLNVQLEEGSCWADDEADEAMLYTTREAAEVARKKKCQARSKPC